MEKMKRQPKKSILWLALLVSSFLIIYGAVYFGFITAFYEMTLVSILINVILAVGLNLVIGVAGQFSLGHAGFMAIGAYSAALVTKANPTIGGLIVGIVIGMFLALVTAIIVGIPTLRLKGDYLAIATLGVAEIIRIVILNMRDFTNGAAGLSGIPYLSTWQVAFIAAAATVTLAGFYTNSNPGRMTLAVREDETAAQSLGINTTKYKLIAFSLGAMTASLGGSIHATYYSVINPDQFNFMRSVDILIIVVFGGMGSITGSVLAAIILGILNVYLQPFGAIRMILYAVVLIVLMILKPSGLMGTKELNWDWLLKRNKKQEESEETLELEQKEDKNR